VAPYDLDVRDGERREGDWVVVAAAIMEHGRLLAARRRAPADTAGGWELPGGKVDGGETAAAALVREVREELGCDVEVGERIGDAEPLRAGLVLHAYACRLRPGADAGAEPVPHEHDAIRWLAAEELDDVTWLPADLRVVDGLRERLLDGDPLPGGAVGGASRVGGTVRRPTGPWTPAVHGLLEHLAAAGLDGVPRVLGVDARGREVLTYLPGRIVAVDVEEPSDEVLGEAVSWLRGCHEALATYRPVGPVQWRHGRRALGAGEIVCHRDPGAYNWIVADDRFAGVIDWDLAGPGAALEDVAFLAWTGVPLFRETATEAVVRRLRIVARAYGGVGPVEVLRASVARMEQASGRIAAGQAAGDAGMVALRRQGEPGRTRRRVRELRRRVPALERALG